VSEAPLTLIAEGLGCVRGGRQVFAGVSFALASGECLAIVGRNGAGKSSLLRLIAGLVPIEAGRLTLRGIASEARIGEHCHYSGHADALKPALSVEENLSFWMRFYGETGIATPAALDRLGLGHLADLPAGYLSAGQKHRLALARLLVSHRPIWLLDEPTAALDRATQESFADLLAAHLAAGGMAAVATHGDLGVVPDRTLEIGA
jgi:heme exporter protein A